MIYVCKSVQQHSAKVALCNEKCKHREVKGNTISPKLFIACLEEMFKKLTWRHKRIKIGNGHLTNLPYANDIVRYSETSGEVQLMIEKLNR